MRKKLLEWHDINQRDLPWRKTRNPYKIWVSEIILQQTQVITGIKYYHRFIKKFPNIRSLAKAEDIDVLKIWEGLGYYNRALNMLNSAKIILNQYGGLFPGNYSELIQLKGIGPYTAAAISSICKHEQKAVVDGNVYRVLSRLFNIDTPINTSNGRKQFQNIANTLVPRKNPGTYNQAIMDFGAIHCKKHNPECQSCPLKKKCLSHKFKLIKNRPVVNKSRKNKTRYFNFLFMSDKKNFLIHQRDSNEIWKKLYQLPLIESRKKISKNELLQNDYLKNLEAPHVEEKYNMNHKLSHQNLKISFWHIHVKKLIFKDNFQKITLIDVKKHPFPKPLQKYFHKEHRINTKI